jgi:DNA/RNA endonuclease G (NUC1)
MLNKILVLLFIPFLSYTQTIKTGNKLIIDHKDIVLYLSNDTSTLCSKHTIKYSEFKLDSDRDDKWFKDVYKGKYDKKHYVYSGYDLGHLTPSHITSYNDTINHYSFSLFNQAPQLAAFNRGNWAQLESHVEDSIDLYKKNAVVITGVIYDTIPKYLTGSRIKIPVSYFKILYIGKKTYCWIGSNIDGRVTTITLKELNKIFLTNKMSLTIK